jgi:xylan 1,4-beta-xylosidase
VYGFILHVQQMQSMNELIKVKHMFISIWICTAFFVNGLQAQTVEPKPILLADPTVFYHEGVYYLYGTGSNSNTGFEVYTSNDLIKWEGPKGKNEGMALKKGDAYGDKGFWAPQVFHYNNRFYMAYTANENIAIAESESPLGPFVQQKIAKLDASVKQIDPYVFFDSDGKIYLYHVRLQEGNRLFVAELNKDLKSIKPETLKECITASDVWENTQNVSWPVAEGPTVLKINNRYYFFYSANDFRNPDYAVGYAVSETPYGPWKKSDSNPILCRKIIGVNGSGHGDFFIDKDGGLMYVFHSHQSETSVSPRRTALIKADLVKDGKWELKVVMDDKSFYFLKK